MRKDSSKLPHGIRRLFRLPASAARLEREMDDEVRVHIDMRADEYRSRGMSDEDARREALRRFGDAVAFRTFASQRAARAYRRQTFAEAMRAWWQDIQFAYRQYAKAPAFTIVALLTLALGIGANAAIFSVVHRLIIAPLPYPNGNRIVTVTRSDARGDGPFGGRLPVKAWRDRAHDVEAIAAISVDAIMVQDPVEDDTTSAFVTANFLDMLGSRPTLGRAFRAEEETPGAQPVAMISVGLWQHRYGGRSDVIGQTINVNGTTRTIVAVAPAEMGVPMAEASFRGGLYQAIASIWVPRTVESLAGGNTFARLRSGVSVEQATAELNAIVATESQRTATPVREWRLMRAQDFLGARERQTITVLFVAVGVLLLIACANVANLLLARAWSRRREFAVRTALGAGRARLIRQVLTESVLLAVCGGLLGLGVAWEALRLIIAMRPETLAHLAGVHIEFTVLAWSIAVSVATGILFGCAPAFFAAGNSVGDVLRNESRGGSRGVSGQRVRSTLIVFEIAMSLVLLVGAGLLARSFMSLSQMPLGFEPRGLTSIEVLYPPGRMSAPQRFALRQAALNELRATRGVVDAAFGTFPTAGLVVFSPTRLLLGNGKPEQLLGGYVDGLITPNYFRVTQMSVVAGRLPDSLAAVQPADTASMPLPPGALSPGGPPREVVINRTMAMRFWPNGAVGERFSLAGANGSNATDYAIVGVVNDAQIVGAHRPVDDAQIYEYPPQRLPLGMFVVRTNLPPQTLREIVQRAAAPYSSRAIVRSIVRGDDYLRQSLAPARFAMALFSIIAIIALILSAIGLYASIAYGVTQRTREIGVRVALGASGRSVAHLILSDALKLTTIGIVVGSVAALLSTRVLTSLLYGVSANDPFTFAGIISVVGLIALIAAYVPMRRALRIDPMEALRTG
jgi:predicted permease